jgi:uncharacterized membrane protein YeiB
MQTKRIIGYDLARALAIFGMVIVNYKVVMGGVAGSEWLKWLASLFERRAAATSIVLILICIHLSEKFNDSFITNPLVQTGPLELVCRKVAS